MTTEIHFGMSDEDARELTVLTDAPNPPVAVERAVRFTLMHDKDSVQEALKV